WAGRKRASAESSASMWTGRPPRAPSSRNSMRGRNENAACKTQCKTFRNRPRSRSMSREYLNPPGLFHHPNYTRVLTVEQPSKLIYIAGQTPADDNYQPLHPGDLRAQYAAVLDGLTLQLKAAGATWDDVVFRRMYALDVPAFLKVLNDRTL